jgi:hypothetical protein
VAEHFGIPPGNRSVGAHIEAPRRLTRRQLLQATAHGATGLAATGLGLGSLARASEYETLSFPGMGQPGEGLRFDTGPSARIHRVGEPTRFGRDSVARNQQRLMLDDGRQQRGPGTQDLGTIDSVLWGTGLYIGNEFRNWSDATRNAVFNQIANWGFYFASPKVGGYGVTWYGSAAQLNSWRDMCWSAGIGFAPFIYSVPSTYYRDAQICSDLVNNGGGIAIVDMEDEWAGAHSQMTAFGQVFRSYNPYDPIVVTGYGDPITRFGRGVFPSVELARWADGYSPQWYYGVWSVYNQRGVIAAIDWADNECGIEFGWNFAMCPSFSIYTIYHGRRILSGQDISTGEEYGWNWQAPIIWWEYGDMNADLAYYCTN